MAVRTDAEWTALCQVFGDPVWAKDPRFANSLSRWKESSTLDQHLAQYTRQWEAYALATRLREGGVPAGVVQTNRELLSDEHLRARQAFWVISHHLAGTYPYPAPSTRLTATLPQYRYPAPDLGEHNTQLLGGLLGFSPEELRDLEAQGVIGTEVR